MDEDDQDHTKALVPQQLERASVHAKSYTAAAFTMNFI